MALFLGYGSHAVYKIEGLHKIREGEGARNVVFVDDLPMGEVGELFVDLGKLFPL